MPRFFFFVPISTYGLRALIGVLWFGFLVLATIGLMTDAHNDPDAISSVEFLWGVSMCGVIGGLIGRYINSPASASDWRSYEQSCCDVLAANGWHATLTPQRDQGADVIASNGAVKLVVQCKAHRSRVGNEAVQQAHAARAFFDANYAAVVAMGGYTEAAVELARRTGVRLLLTPADLTIASNLFR